MFKLDYSFELKSPVLIANYRGEQNTRSSLDYIPGNIMMAMFLGGLNESDAAEAKIIQAVLAGESAYFGPAGITRNGIQAEPVMMGFYRHKNEASLPAVDAEHSGTETTVYPMIKKSHELPEGQPFKPLAGGWIMPTGNALCRVPVHMVQFTHNTVVPEIQRPNSDVGGVFTYEALASGQEFSGSVYCNDQHTADAVYRVLGAKKTVRLGRSLSAEYGEASMRITAPAAYKADDVPAGKVQLILANDAILMDDAGIALTGITAAYLQALAGKRGFADVTVTSDDEMVNYSDTRTVNGFNTLHGQFRSSVLAVTRGSVFHFEVGGNDAGAFLRSIYEKGIGERRNEGFGRLTSHHSMQDWARQNGAVVNRVPASQISANSGKHWYHVDGLPDSVAEAVFTKKVTAASYRVVEKYFLGGGKLKSAFRSKPSNSQLQGLRTIALRADSVNQITTFMVNKIGKRADKDGEWNGSIELNIGKTKLMKFFSELINERDFFYQFLGLPTGNYFFSNKKYHVLAVKLFIIQLVGMVIKWREQNAK